MAKQSTQPKKKNSWVKSIASKFSKGKKSKRPLAVALDTTLNPLNFAKASGKSAGKGAAKLSKSYGKLVDKMPYYTKNKKSKNSIVKGVAKKFSEASEGARAIKGAAKSKYKAFKGARKLEKRLLPKRYVGEKAMDLGKYQNLSKSIRKKIKSGDYKGAREYSREKNAEYYRGVKK